MDSKFSQEKHKKYLDFYETLKKNKEHDTEYWGLGIENESYLMFEQPDLVLKEFAQKNHRRERYSVDYWLNYKPEPLKAALDLLPPSLRLPVYVNSYMFRKADLLGEHTSTYEKNPKPNPRFSDETIDQYLRRVSPTFVKLFETTMIYDGDTFEFATFNFYKTTVHAVVDELKGIKQTFLAEVNAKLVSKFTMFKQRLIYPPFNYGFAKFLTNPKNLAICNNGTYHMNVTLPTPIKPNGDIVDEAEFKRVHANAIRAIQWMEPLLVGLYGTPDILHVLNPEYAGGSQRLGLSRYIGLGTYDTTTMEKGKLLDTYDHAKSNSYFKTLHFNSPYIPPKTTGFDVNYNKFTKHGIEIRIFDSFPEAYLEHVINLILLVCQYSTEKEIPNPRDCALWNKLCLAIIQKGSAAPMLPDIQMKFYEVFQIPVYSCWPYYFNETALNLTRTLARSLYNRCKNKSICLKMSPNMKPIHLVDYNSIVKKEFAIRLKN